MKITIEVDQHYPHAHKVVEKPDDLDEVERLKALCHKKHDSLERAMDEVASLKAKLEELQVKIDDQAVSAPAATGGETRGKIMGLAFESAARYVREQAAEHETRGGLVVAHNVLLIADAFDKMAKEAADG